MAQHATITDDMVSRLRTRIGVERRCRNPWVTEATFDSIRHWAWAVGDDNPLWLDRDYAEAGPFGTIVAPPCFLYAANHGPMGPGSPESRGTGMPGIHGLHVADEWKFVRPVQEGETLEAVGRLVEVEERSGKYSQRQVWQTTEWEFLGTDGGLLATLRTSSASTERGGGTKSKAKYSAPSPWVYSTEELAGIASDYAGEDRRGESPIFWDDVKVGASLGKIRKGPLTVQNMVSFWAAWGCIFGMNDKIWYDFVSGHPRAPFQDPRSNVWDVPDAAHYHERFAQEIGLPMGYDIGTQRVTWFAHLLTNWMGDRGELAELRVELLRPNWVGDTTVLSGVVDRIEAPDQDCGAVHCIVEATNQRGEVHSKGSALVKLPRRPLQPAEEGSAER